MPETNPQQLSFGGGVNAVAPPHLVGENEVQAATNIDFSLERGAASVRRGCQHFQTVGTDTCQFIWGNYNKDSAFTVPYYFVVAGTGTDGSIVRAVCGAGGSATTTTILPAGATTVVGFGAYNNKAYISVPASTNCICDDGTTTTEWIKQHPDGTLHIDVGTLTAFNVTTTYSVTEGTAVGTGTETYTKTTTTVSTNTATDSLGSLTYTYSTATSTTTRAMVTTTATTGTDTYRITMTAVPSSTDFNLNGTHTIGDYGFDTLFIGFTDPSVVARVSRDYSIDGTSFTDYWHTEMDTEYDIGTYSDEDAISDVDKLIHSEDSDLATRAEIISTARRSIRCARTCISAASDTLNAWTKPRTKIYQVTTSDSVSGWSHIGAVRVIIECYEPTTVHVGTWEIKGAENYSLTDTDVGYAWWETFATFGTTTTGTTTVKLGESAPSVVSPRVKMQSSQAIVVSTATTTGTMHGLTHRILYRQGGYLADAYAVATNTITNATYTDTLPDVKVLIKNIRLNRNTLSRAKWPQNVRCVEQFKDRIFIAYENNIAWSSPGLPDTFSAYNFIQVSPYGDNVVGLHSYGSVLCIVTRDGVYELQGNIFEGSNTDYTLYRTGARHGSKAPRTIIRTPYGIPLLDYDGISLYTPGQNIDQSLTWAMEKMADVFRGPYSYSPAYLKGTRLPPLNYGGINHSCAAWADDKLYLAMPCLTDQIAPNYLFVLDFRTQQVWTYTYPFNIWSLYWDFVQNRLLAGTSDGNVMLLEFGLYDETTAGTATNISYSLVSRAWTTPADTLLENISVEHGGGTTTVLGLYGGTSTATIGTLTSTGKEWLTPPLLGSVTKDITFKFLGAQATDTQETLYGIQWDALVEPKRVEYWRTDYDINNYDGEKIWDVHFADLQLCLTGTATVGTVSATIYVDNTAVKTATYVAPAGREIYPTSIPVNSLGDVAYTVYRAGTGTLFKHWKTTFVARNEPPRITEYKTDIQSLEEQICDAMDVDVDPNGTVTSTVYVDNVSVGTYTTVGTSGRQSYTYALPGGTAVPHGLYGRTLFAVHTGTNFKHYKTWFHLRPEPDRWTNYMSDRESSNEKFFQTFECDIDPLGGTVYATVVVDNTAVSTYTMTGSGRQSYPWSIPEDTFGRTIYTTYTCSGSGRFKHYRTWYEGSDEPDRLSLVQHGPVMFPSDQHLRTWVVDLNPLGTCSALLYVDNTAVSTETFVGTKRQVYRVGLDVTSALALRTAAYEVDVTYHSVGAGAKIKHYDTKFETEPKPFGKKTWSIIYKKIGGATQLDLARFWSFDIEAQGTATVTSVWDIDGEEFQTNTFTISNTRWKDRIAFEPGARGYLFQQRLLSGSNVHVWKSNIDMIRVGIKGLSRVTVPGTPNQNS